MDKTYTNSQTKKTRLRQQAPPSLSLRERAVLEYAAQGLDNGEIAKILYVSSHTVKAHIASALKKLSAINRTHAVYIALKKKLIE